MNIFNLEKIFRHKSQEGFTISELIISITIIGILAAIAVPSGLKWIDKEKQNAYIRELISYLILVKKETRRWNGSCTLQTNTFSRNPYDPVTRRWLGVDAFKVRCFGMDNAEKKSITVNIPKIEENIFQEVSVNTFSFTPKGQISVPGSQNSLVIVVGARPDGGDFYQKPKCILIEAPIGMISTGTYQNNMRFYRNRNGNSINSQLRQQTCNKL